MEQMTVDVIMLRMPTFRPLSGRFSSLSLLLSVVIVSCSGCRLTMGSGAQWLLKTCRDKQYN